ncbi:pilus assembly protein PilZ [Clostridium botulinum]|uniref:flagellar brake protein n=1 Tax=Clostridium botulinum TaxID=1491 RepID=UPI0013C954B3|nr:flagellar brake domain-containing protein [Clostridium botulinum]MBN1041216.1 pilus assembly protein PilZ [Clostridium botulinum]MBN1064059.1 pilus assembly protein PilZ [Clostridium botulinum]MBN1076815.1 pilus assembly protein PilZ [Clostridium botulinum]MBY6836375.1 PilZ domain-containing protein [Clostridium botulinum]NFG63564.1 pilus assembly protein PilZ [Clostridium botulinum]
MSKFILKINDRVEVLVGDRAFKSLVQDIEDDYIKINIPVCEGEYLALKIDNKIELNSYARGGKCFNFHCDVIERGKEGNIIYYKLSEPYNVKEIQRRDFVRVDFMNIVKFKKIMKTADEEVTSFKDALMIDLSGGGMRFKAKEKLEKYDKLLLEFELNDKLNYLKAQIMRLEITEFGEYLYGVKFIDISEIQRDKVISEIFNIMRKQRERL